MSESYPVEHVNVAAATWRDYLEMCKPRVVLLMLLTAAVGMFLAPTGTESLVPPLATVLLATFGIALVAGSAAVVNHVADAHVDERMARTKNRPVAQGRVAPSRALLFSAALGVSGMWVLGFFVNPLTAWLNLFSWVGYGLIYTLVLKHLTPQNIVLGGLFGALPPLLGWTAITGTLAIEPILLVLIIFVWTPPHFWALALDRIEDYAATDVPMLPITHGVTHTRLQILAYTIALSLVSVTPYFIGMSHLPYLWAALALNAGFLYWALALAHGREDAPLKTFHYSIVYLGLLFLALLIDHYLSSFFG